MVLHELQRRGTRFCEKRQVLRRKAAEKIEQLGIKTRDSSGEMLGATEIAQELQNKLGGLDAATRDAALQTIFGSDAMRAATVLMNSGAEGLKKYTDATNDQEAASRRFH